VDVYTINPLLDDRWTQLVSHHAHSTSFHERGWLQALAHTYGYEPIVLTTTPAGQALQNGVVLCRVSSWITGRRFVSLPFSDHCDPLVDQAAELEALTRWLQRECDRQQCRFAELRAREKVECAGWLPAQSFWLHELDLSPTLAQLFEGLHKDSIQRKVRRAEREKLTYDAGRSEKYIDEFYRLLLKTRRRHQLFPQPESWFRNLLEYMVGHAEIRVARKDGVAVAAMLTLRHRASVIYKYGCSDESRHHLGGMPFLFWRLIEESKNAGAEQIDFGRSDLDQEGLVVFKNRFGAKKQQLTYSRYCNPAQHRPGSGFNIRAAQHLFPVLPDVALTLGGRFLYRHMG